MEHTCRLGILHPAQGSSRTLHWQSGQALSLHLSQLESMTAVALFASRSSEAHELCPMATAMTCCARRSISPRAWQWCWCRAWAKHGKEQSASLAASKLEDVGHRRSPGVIERSGLFKASWQSNVLQAVL